MDTKHIQLPLTEESIAGLRAGDSVLLSGTVYTGRDAAHKRIAKAIGDGAPLPFDLNGATVYYVGPAPAYKDQPVGAAGPTTSYRMDAYTPLLLAHGLKGMIGKGDRSDEVISAIKRNKAVYFAAVGGAAALLAKHIRSSRVICYEDLGTEAVHEFVLDEFPVIVAIDSNGEDIYKSGRSAFLESVGKNPR